MLSSIHSRHVLAPKAWYKPLKLSQSRPKSTAQGIASLEGQSLVNKSTLVHDDGSSECLPKGEQDRTNTLTSSSSRSMLSLKPEDGLLKDVSQYDPPLAQGGDLKQSDGRSPSILSTRYYKAGEQAKLRDKPLARHRFPFIPQVLFPKVIENLRQLLQSFATFSSSFFTDSSRSVCCLLTCTFLQNNVSETTQGYGSSRATASVAAYRRMLTRLHENGRLREILGSDINKIYETALSLEKEAKFDIYNFAARFDSIPEIEVRTLSTQRGPGQKIYEVIVRLPQQDIVGFGRSKYQKSAENVAVLQFKKKAEEFQAEHKEKFSITNDHTTLSTSTSRQFFEFYKTVYPNSRVELLPPNNNQPANDENRKVNAVQTFIDAKPMGQALRMERKKDAVDLALLTAAVEVKRKDPGLYQKFLEALQAGSGKILSGVAPVQLSVDENCLSVMRETLASARNAGLPNQIPNLGPEDDPETVITHLRARLTPSELETRNQQLHLAFSRYLENPHLEALRRKKAEMPINQFNSKVLDLINNNQYSIIVGGTGCGKTTQVPQIIIEDAICRGQGAYSNIICTQPRRIAAVAIAKRVAQERAEMLQDTVGYHIHSDRMRPRQGGSITYCTTGVLLRHLQSFPDEIMDFASHLIIDEVHEREKVLDFLLSLLKSTIAKRISLGKSTPKVVFMSATVDTELFARYFRQSAGVNENFDCPTLSVPGRTFPVEEKYLDDIFKEFQSAHPQEILASLQADKDTKEYLKGENWFRKQKSDQGRSKARSVRYNKQANKLMIDQRREHQFLSQDAAISLDEKEESLAPKGLVAFTVAHLAKTTRDGAILVFLPGLTDILSVQELLLQNPLNVSFEDESKFRIYLLHSSLAGQPDVFEKLEQGCRKIILATNIAESSVTIPEVQYVVDTGKFKEKQYDQMQRISSLNTTWISKSSSKQRAGRAGRVQDGNYYALFSKERYASLRAVGRSEILRSDLQNTCLDVKARQPDCTIHEFLADLIEPPDPKRIQASIENLIALGALTTEEELTSLGQLLASMPVHPSLGKMIVMGVIFRCLDPMLILGAARSLFNLPKDLRKAASESKSAFVQGSGSDHIAFLTAVRELRRTQTTFQGGVVAFDYAYKNFINFSRFRMIEGSAKQLEEILAEAGLIPQTPPFAPRNGEYGHPTLNENSSRVPLIKALLLRGLHPNLAVFDGELLRTPREKDVSMARDSVNYADFRHDGRSSLRSNTLYSYSTMERSAQYDQLFVRDTSKSTALMAALFGGKITQRSASSSSSVPGQQQQQELSNIIEMDGWLPLAVTGVEDKPAAATTIIEFREALDRMLAMAFQDLQNPTKTEGEYLADDKLRAMFAQCIVSVLEQDAKAPVETGAGTGPT
ncbi:MAG: hypothetical protein Q9167_003707 [Letrouitia subvulpina]